MPIAELLVPQREQQHRGHHHRCAERGARLLAPRVGATGRGHRRDELHRAEREGDGRQPGRTEPEGVLEPRTERHEEALRGGHQQRTPPRDRPPRHGPVGARTRRSPSAADRTRAAARRGTRHDTSSTHRRRRPPRLRAKPNRHDDSAVTSPSEADADEEAERPRRLGEADDPPARRVRDVVGDPRGEAEVEDDLRLVEDDQRRRRTSTGPATPRRARRPTPTPSRPTDHGDARGRRGRRAGRSAARGARRPR